MSYTIVVAILLREAQLLSLIYILMLFLVLLVEPTAAPQDVTYGDRTNVSITLIWSPPPFDHQNGLIRSYSIRVTHSVSGSQRMLTTTSNSTTFTVGGLEPHTSYLFSTAAETISLGPYSMNVNISTVEGSKLPCN